jgi:hypothetical protein
MALFMLTLAACSKQEQKNINAADIKIESPIVFSHNSVKIADKSTVFVNIEMISGQYAYDEFPGNNQGSNWSGQYQIRVYKDETDFKNPICLAPVSIAGSQPMDFKSEFALAFDDYNNDNNPDFTLGQYVSSNGYEYALFTINQAGEAEKLDTDGLMYISEHDYSVKLEKLSSTSFAISSYDNGTGETVKTIYQWKENRFIPEEPKEPTK